MFHTGFHIDNEMSVIVEHQVPHQTFQQSAFRTGAPAGASADRTQYHRVHPAIIAPETGNEIINLRIEREKLPGFSRVGTGTSRIRALFSASGTRVRRCSSGIPSAAIPEAATAVVPLFRKYIR
jgi:hypothetical protein